MRSRLAASLRYILAQGDGVLTIPQERFQKFLTDLEARPVSPLAFSFYNDAVLAIEEDDIKNASQLLTELTTLPSRADGLEIIDLADPKQDAVAARYARFLNDDPSVSFDIFPPQSQSPKNAARKFAMPSHSWTRAILISPEKFAPCCAKLFSPPEPKTPRQ